MSEDVEAMLRRLPIEGPAPEAEQRVRELVLEEFDRASRRAARPGLPRRLFQTGVAIVFHPASRFAAAAAFLLAAAFVVWPRTASASLAEFLRPALQAKTVKFKATSTGPNDAKIESTCYFKAPDHQRMESKGSVTVIDGRRHRMTTLMSDMKQAIVADLVGAAEKPQKDNLFANFREMGAKAVAEGAGKDLGEKTVDGAKLHAFEMSHAGMTLVAYGDPKTNLLKRVDYRSDGSPPMQMSMTDFEFDVEIDDALFSTEPPSGYKVTSTKLDLSPASEKDFADALSSLLEMNGEFPAGFDSASVSAAISSGLMKSFKAEDAEKKDIYKEMMAKAAPIGRGLSFVNALPPSADAHYAGRGVKKGAAKSPIFWYRPKDSAKYRVLNSDLSFEDAAAAPELKNAKKL